MQQSVNIELPGVGPVLFERSAKAKRLSISVKPFRGVRVAVPRTVTFQLAEVVVRGKIPWMRRTVSRVKAMEEEHAALASNQTFDRSRAEQILLDRLDELAIRHGFTYNRAAVRSQKTRWGSCSANNNISLNMKLAELPGEMMDYVILHELVHTRIKNHGKEFWGELDQLVGDAKAVRRKMRGLPAAILLG